MVRPITVLHSMMRMLSNLTFLEATHEKEKQKLLNHTNLTANSSRSCVMISTKLDSFGNWLSVNCDKQIRRSVVVCQKSRNIDPPSINVLRRASNECSGNEIYLNMTCYNFLTLSGLSRKCQTFHFETFGTGLIREMKQYLTKWTRARMQTIGYWRSNNTYGLCVKRLCEQCADYNNIDWYAEFDCPPKTVKYWICRSPIAQAHPKCFKMQQKCNDDTCILNHYVCDRIADCPDHSDEHKCHGAVTCTAEYDCYNHCPKYYCYCSKNYLQLLNRCIPLYEWYRQWVHVEPRIMNISRITTQTVSDCPDGWSKCSHNETSTCYPNAKVCVFERCLYGEPLYCANTEHLHHCVGHECPSMFSCDNMYCIPHHMVCDGVVDCPDGQDEAHYKCESLSCPGLFRCRYDNKCIHPNFYCDGVTDCLLSNDDEEMCVPCHQGCKCIGLSVLCYEIDMILPSQMYHFNGVFIELLKGDFKWKRFNPNLYIMNVSSVYLNNIIIKHSINIHTNLISLTMIDNNLNKLVSFVFNNLRRLRFLDIQSNKLECIQSNAFSGLHAIQELLLSRLNIQVLETCSLCGMAKLLLLDLSQNNISEFNAEMLLVSNPIHSVNISTNNIQYVNKYIISSDIQHILTNQKVVCCYIPVRALPQFCKSVNFQLCETLLINDLVSYIFVVYTIFLLVINVYVIVSNITKDINHFTIIQHVTFADMWYVVYMMMLMGTHFYYSDQFPFHRELRMNSIQCRFEAFAVILSLLQSKCISVLVEVNYVLVTKFSIKKHALSQKTIICLLCTSWSINTILASLFVVHTEQNDIYCSPFLSANQYVNVVYILFSIILVVRGVFMGVCYCTIVLVVHASGQKVQQGNVQLFKRRLRSVLIKAIVAILGFLVSSFFVTLSMFWRSEDQDHMLKLCLLEFGISCDALINPFLYTIASRLQSSKQRNSNTKRATNCQESSRTITNKKPARYK